MNKIEAVALRIVPSIRAVAKAHTRHAALLVLAAACLFLGGVVRAADTSAAARNARMLAAQQQRIEQNPLPTDLVAVQLNQVPRTVNSLFSLSHWPFCPPLPAACASSYPDSPLYLSPSLNALFVDDRQREALAAAMAAADLPPIPGGTNDYGTYDDPGPSSGPRVD